MQKLYYEPANVFADLQHARNFECDAVAGLLCRAQVRGASLDNAQLCEHRDMHVAVSFPCALSRYCALTQLGTAVDATSSSLSYSRPVRWLLMLSHMPFELIFGSSCDARRCANEVVGTLGFASRVFGISRNHLCSCISRQRRPMRSIASSRLSSASLHSRQARQPSR